jgi:hypothetical protein
MLDQHWNTLKFNSAASHGERHSEVLFNEIDRLAELADGQPTQTFSMRMPFALYLEFKKLTRQLKDAAPASSKDKFTMTSFVNYAVAVILIPALKEKEAVDHSVRNQL